MTKENINTLLHEKMCKEFNNYKDWLVKQPPDVIMHHANEYAVKQDICMFMDEHNISVNLAKALYDSPCPLEDSYKEYSRRDTYRMYDVERSVEIAANKLAIAPTRMVVR